MTMSHNVCSIRKEESNSALMHSAHTVHGFLVKLRAALHDISGVSTRHKLIRVTLVRPPAKIVTFEHDFSLTFPFSEQNPTYGFGFSS